MTAREATAFRAVFFWRKKGTMNEHLFLEEAQRFERCEYGLQEFGHREHLKVAWTYLQLYGYDAALVRMREGLLRFSAHHNRSGYNETITVFWMRKLQAHQGEDPNDILRSADKEMLFRHFSRERAMSEEAKRQWIEPDLLPI
jgi:hypothetical protein